MKAVLISPPFLLLFSLLGLSPGLKALNDSLAYNGQLVGWAGLNMESPSGQLVGGRFLPELYYLHQFNKKSSFDIDLSANVYAGMTFKSWSYMDDQTGVKPYRASLRFSSEQWELRAGLQKISFGSATLLRPLMWFDGTDPRDPLKFTEGVYGLLGRYYLLNNANLWAWGLLGNKDPRGWDIVPGLENKPEFGGRIQWPVLGGELAFTYNHRQPGSNRPYLPDIFPYDSFRYKEDKFGIDGKWTIGPGIWFEYVLKHNQGQPDELFKYENYLCTGIDYTFALGNGLNVAAEHLLYSGTHSKKQHDQLWNLSAATLSYPFGLMDRVSAIVYRSWDTKIGYYFLNFQRQYDDLSLYLLLFWNPDSQGSSFILPGASAQNGMDLYSGKGLMIMATYNF